MVWQLQLSTWHAKVALADVILLLQISSLKDDINLLSSALKKSATSEHVSWGARSLGRLPVHIQTTGYQF
jgi:hypothetical protein